MAPGEERLFTEIVEDWDRWASQLRAAALLQVLSALWVCCVVRRLPPGWRRAGAAAPALGLAAAIPLVFCRPADIVTTAAVRSPPPCGRTALPERSTAAEMPVP
jgi:hypothetical protein